MDRREFLSGAALLSTTLAGCTALAEQQQSPGATDTMTFEVQNGQGAQSLDIETILHWIRGDAVASGCAPSDGTNAMEVDIASGTVRVDGSAVSVSAQTVTLLTGGTDPRKDLIWIDSTGTVQVSQGLEAPYLPSGNTGFDTHQPSPPDSTGVNGAVVAEVVVDAGASDIDGTPGQDLRDRRILNANLVADSVETDEVSLTDQTLVYVYGSGGNLVETYDPANYADLFAALNQVMTDVSDTEQVTIQLPYTGSGGVSASTTFSIPSGQVEPTVRGWGAYGTVINYTATDGTPAIEVANAGNVAGPDWSHFALIGPGKAAAGAGNGVDISGTISHAQDFHHLRIESFPGTGFLADGFFTGSLHHCQIQHCGVRGLDLERLNAGSIHNNLIQKNGNATANEQVLLTDCLGGYFGPGNIVDSRGGDTGTLTQVGGVLVEAVNKRSGPWIVGNYFEDCDTHIEYVNNGVPCRGVGPFFNRFQTGTTGVHVGSTNNTMFVGPNWYDNFTDAVLTDSGAYVWPQIAFGTTNTVTDNSTSNQYMATSTTYDWT